MRDRAKIEIINRVRSILSEREMGFCAPRLGSGADIGLEVWLEKRGLARRERRLANRERPPDIAGSYRWILKPGDSSMRRWPHSGDRNPGDMGIRR